MKKRFGLLGEKLGHSYSKLVHGYLGDYDYQLFEVRPEDFGYFMSEKSFDGINITIPYKRAVMPFCASLSDEALSSNCINTIIKDDVGLLHGYNTDYHGFRVLLRHNMINPLDKKALVIGNGGAAHTVRSVLSELGAREIVTICRIQSSRYKKVFGHQDAEIIVNATPVGMYPNNESVPISLEGFPKLSSVVDLIYNPSRTRLLLEAERQGLLCVNGLIMLVAQAEMTSNLFLKKTPQPNSVGDIAQSVAKRTQNIALIGMPGSGKSTVAQILAKKLRRPLSDIDSLIEKAAGKSIPKIFSEDGEGVFRQLETRVLGEESKKTGLVIATGGGVVINPNNVDLLRQNSLIVYLRRELDDLTLTERPLSQSIGVKAIAYQRLPLYESWKDCVVDVEAEPELTVAKILEVI